MARDTVGIQSTSLDSLQYGRLNESLSPIRVGDLYQLVGLASNLWKHDCLSTFRVSSHGIPSPTHVASPNL